MLRKFLSRIYRKLPVVRELDELKAQLAAQSNLLIASQQIALVDFALSQHPRYADPKRLLCYQTQVCSQSHEDGIIHEIFRRIGTTNRVFAEIGVGNGSENNTAFLLSKGWTGFWIDGNPSFVATLEGRADISPESLRYLVSFVTRENSATLFQQLGVPKEADLLSLDIDQNTYYLWEGLKEYRARVVVVEYNPALPPDMDWKVRYDGSRTWDSTQNYGASLKAFELLGRELGYSLVGCDFAGINAFFVRDDLVEDLFATPFTAENHFEPSRFLARRCHPRSIPDCSSNG